MASLQVKSTDPLTIKRHFRNQFSLRVSSYSEPEQPQLAGIKVASNITNALCDLDRPIGAFNQSISASPKRYRYSVELA